MARDEDRVVLELSPAQADVVDRALDLYSRMVMGQVGEVVNLAREGLLPKRVPDGHARATPDLDDIDRIEDAMKGVRAVIGDWHGIGHRHVDVSGKRAYEVGKALAKVLAERRNPDPEMRGVAYDGVTVRYTADPEPLASVMPGDGA